MSSAVAVAKGRSFRTRKSHGDQMDQLNNVEKDVQKVHGNFEQFYAHYDATISALLADAKRLKEAANSGSDGSSPADSETSGDVDSNAKQTEAVREFMKRAKQVASQLANEHKELHGCVSKLGKCIDKNFVNEDNLLLADGYFQPAERRTLLDRAIVDHLVRHGMLDVATSYGNECGLNAARKSENASENGSRKAESASETGRKSDSGLTALRETHECGAANELLENEKITQFARVHAVCGSLREHRLEEALAWCDEHRARLAELGSLLEFELHRLAFVELLRTNAGASQRASDLSEPIRYARRIANELKQLREEVKASPDCDSAVQKRKLVAAGERELQTLMGTLLYAQRGLENSPYAHLLDPIRWTEVSTFRLRQKSVLRVSKGDFTRNFPKSDSVKIEVSLNFSRIFSSDF